MASTAVSSFDTACLDRLAEKAPARRICLAAGHETASEFSNNNEAHLWLLDLDLAPEAEFECLAGLLNDGERLRAARLAFALERRRFILCRAMLRKILSAYTGIPPARLRFEANAWGKPRLADGGSSGDGGGDLHFNLSHSGGLALFAFARGYEVGVDIEHFNPRIGVVELARDCFSVAEQKALALLPEAARVAAFFACWSRKEAYAKARGLGLSLDLRAFDASLSSGEQWTLREAGEDVSAAWTLFSFCPSDDSAAALAIPAPGFNVCMFRWHWPEVEALHQ